MKFLIKCIENPVQYNGQGIVWGTGETPFINHSEPLNGRKIAGGKIKFKTGLNSIDIDTNKSLTTEEKAIYKEKLETDLPRIFEFFPELKTKEENVVNDEDDTFWSYERTNFVVTNEGFSVVHDTDNPDDLLLYYGIIGGGFAGIAPTQDIAERNMGIRFYMTDESTFATQNYQEEFGVKRKAIGALDKLLSSKGKDPLLYITYMTLPEGKGFTKNTSADVLEKALMEYIEGKTTKTGKKNAAQSFYDNYKLFEADKETFIGKALLSAAIHFQIVYQKDGKLWTSLNNTMLGSKLDDSYKALMKPENQKEFDDIRKIVEEKLNK